jgi:hypothetical protein
LNSVVTVESTSRRISRRNRSAFWTAWALVLGGASLGLISQGLGEYRGFVVGAGTAFWLTGIAMQMRTAPRFFELMRHR